VHNLKGFFWINILFHPVYMTQPNSEVASCHSFWGMAEDSKFSVEMGPDLTRPNPSILLTCSEKETNPSLTWILFYQTRWDFFWQKIENFWDFLERYSKPKPKMADPIQPELQKIDPTQFKIVLPKPISKTL